MPVDEFAVTVWHYQHSQWMPLREALTEARIHAAAHGPDVRLIRRRDRTVLSLVDVEPLTDAIV